MLAVAEDPTIGLALLLVAAILSAIPLWWIGVPIREYHDRLCDRWLYGVPWGSLVVVGFVLAVYLFPQRGFWDWYRPIVVAYTAVSIFDPTGWLLAGFAHTSPGHLRGNITSTLVFGPIVEWIWRHKPASEPRDFEPSWSQIPLVRAFVLFPLGVGIIGVTAALFSWGPVIGFSVAVYALIGIAVVHYPVLTLVGLVAREAVRVLWRTWTDPIVLSETTIRAVRPSWYGTAVQGHLVGLLLGVAIGVVLVRYHQNRPSPARLWGASALLGFYLSLWALWWVMGPEQFVLFRAIGIALVLAVATVIAASVVAPSRGRYHRVRRIRQGALVILLVSLLGMGVIGVGLNLTTAEAPNDPPTIAVEDYEIYYAENVPDGMINVVEFEALGLTTDVRTSGVIVYSEDRNVWRQTVSKADLEARGSDRFTVGGLGWGEEIRVHRAGWVPTGGQPVYQVWMADEDGWHHAFASEPAIAEVRIDDRQFALAANDGEFFVGVAFEEEEVEWVSVPGSNESVSAHDIELTREGERLIAIRDGTEVTIATRETYR